MTMLCTKEPIVRPAEHNKQPNIVEIRIPNLLRKAPVTGLTKHRTPNTIEETQAVKQRKNVISLLNRTLQLPFCQNCITNMTSFRYKHLLEHQKEDWSF